MTTDKQQLFPDNGPTLEAPRRQFTLLHLTLVLLWCGVMLGLARIAERSQSVELMLLLAGILAISLGGYVLW